MQYTDEQQAVIEHKEGHAIAKAVAGSGKTAVMVGRIIHLLKLGVDPKKILVLMFNNTARNDFYRRLKKEMVLQKVDHVSDRIPEVRTISSLALRTIELLQDSEVLPVYDIMFDDAKIQNRLVRDALRKSQVEPSAANVDYLKAIISWIKSRCDDEINYHGETNCEEVVMFLNFEKIRHEQKLRFFDDWAYDTVNLIKEDPEIIYDVLSSRYQHIIIDEFQDVNNAQMQIIDVYINPKTSLMVVGDPQQSIYGFRGSDPRIMLEYFPDKYKPTSYNLSKTFRFGPRSSKAANNLISYNQLRFDLDCHSAAGTPDTKIFTLDQDEYRPAELIKHYCPDDDYQSIAVLCREKWHWLQTEIECLKHGIPYYLPSKESPSFLAQPAVKSLLGYLRLADEAELFKKLPDSERFSVMASMIGIPSLSILLACKKQIIDRLKDNPDSYNIFPDTAEMLMNSQLDNEQVKKQLYALERRETVFDMSLGLNGDKGNAVRALKAISSPKRLNYVRYFESTAVRVKDADYRTLMINGLIELAEHVQDQYPTINGFLGYLDQLHENYQNRTIEDRQTCLTIITMHQSKGLQYDHIIIPELHAETMPAQNEKGVDDIEGERRLFYVAITRARKTLHLVQGNDPSVFINECFEKCVNQEQEEDTE